MKYFLYGYFGFNNFGDDLLLKTMIAEIEKKDSNSKFYIKNFDDISDFKDRKNIILTNIEKILQSRKNVFYKVLMYIKSSCYYIDETNVFIIGPGGLFLDKGKLNKSILLLFLMVFYAKIKHKKIIILGVSFDIIANPINLYIIKKIFQKADFISLRDGISFSYAKYLTSYSKIKQTKDLIFLLDIKKNNPVITDKVGICLIDYYGEYEKDIDKQQLFYQKMYDEISNIKDKEFIYISLQESEGLNDDIGYNFLVNKGLRLEYFVLNQDNIESLSSFDSFITMRYHLAIFGLLYNKKVFIIDHEIKMSSLKLEFDVGYITIDDLIKEVNIFNTFFENEYKNNITALKKKSEDNFQWLK